MTLGNIRIYLLSILFFLLGAASADAIIINDLVAQQTPGGVSNYYDKNNQFPSVVVLIAEPHPLRSWCTGTVINHRAVLTANHCENFYDSQIRMGPNVVNGSYLDKYRASGQQYISQSHDFGDNDISFVSVGTPITGIQPIPLATQLYQIPTKGGSITFVGYGSYGTGTNCCDLPDGKRRIATSELGLYGTDLAAGVTQPGLWAQFRNPLTPYNPNYYNLTQSVSTLEGTTAPGDSGGPVFGVYNGQFIQLGVLSGGGNPYGDNSGYGDLSYWNSVVYFKDWLAQNNPLRQLDSSVGNYNWSNSSAWLDSVPGVPAAVPNNSTDNTIDNQPNIARYYEVNIGRAGEVTLDINATIDSLTISGADSQLKLQSHSLTTILGSNLINGEINFSNGALLTPNLNLDGGILSGSGVVSKNIVSANTCQDNTICNSGSQVSVVGQVRIQSSYSQFQGSTILQGGRLSISGDYSQSDGLLGYVGGSRANNLLSVNGRADLAGGVMAAELGLPGYLPSTRINLLHAAGGVNGAFNSISTDTNYSFLAPSLLYDANNVYLSFSLTPFSVVGRTLNQRNVGNTLTLGAYGPISGPGANILNTLFYGSYQSAQSVMDTVGGAGLAGVQTTAMEVGQMVSSTVSDQIAFWRSGETNDITGVTLHEDNSHDRARSFMAYAPTDVGVTTKNPITIKGPVAGLSSPHPPARTYRAWGSMFGGGANFLSDAGRGTPSATAGYYGGLLGVDYQLTPNALVGLSLGGSSAGFSVGSLATTGSLTGFHAGLYGSYTMGSSYLALNETLSGYSNKTNRSASGYSFLPYESLTANFGSTELRTRLEGGHSLLMGGLKATPFVAAEIAAYNIIGFSERSSLLYQSSLALKNNGQAINSLPTFVGLRLSNAYTLQNGWRLAPIGSLAYVHEFFPQRQFTNILMSMPGQDFNVAGPRSTYNLVQTKLGAQLFLNKAFALYSDFQGEFSSMSQSYGGTAGMKYYW